MSCDEEFHLVIPKLPMQYTNGPGSPPLPEVFQGQQRLSQTSEGDLILSESNDTALNRFHENAIKQTGVARYQCLATLVTAVGLIGHTMQMYTIPYVVPSAEVEYCIREEKKNWLSGITFVGIAIGSLILGGLAGRIGRRRCLLSSLAVSGVFSVIAAFMPTYGPFMMAKFCASMGVGGILPAGACYIFEISPHKARIRLLGIFVSLGLMGGLLAGMLARISIPWTGQEVIIESAEHFSDWHRYLLFSSIPFFISIFGLLWLSESPRYLLDCEREVEALQTYQKIFRMNKVAMNANLTELELPGSQYHHTVTTSVVTAMKISFSKFISSFCQLFQKVNLKITVLLVAIWISSLFTFSGLTAYTIEYSKAINIRHYEQNTIDIKNKNYRNSLFNASIENTVYINCTFSNSTFKQMFMNHVQFLNCTFKQTGFKNVKTSKSLFQYSTLNGVSLIDTDLSQEHFQSCALTNLTVIRLQTECEDDFDYNIYFDALWRTHFASLAPTVLMTAIGIGELVHRCGKSRIATVCHGFALVLCVIVGMLHHEDQVAWTVGGAQGLIMTGVGAVSILALEHYKASQRCSILGVLVCGGHVGAQLGASIFKLCPITSFKAAATISTVSLFIPFMSSIVLKDVTS